MAAWPRGDTRGTGSRRRAPGTARRRCWVCAPRCSAAATPTTSRSTSTCSADRWRPAGSGVRRPLAAALVGGARDAVRVVRGLRGRPGRPARARRRPARCALARPRDERGGRGRARGRRRRGGAAPAARRRRPARARCSRTLRIDAPPSLVWAVLTSPDQSAQWFGQSATFPDGVHAGATGTFGWTDVAAHRAAMADHAEGWERELDELVAHVTTLRRGGGAVANLDAGTITRTVLVGADRPTVWRALTTPAAIEASARPTTRQRPASHSASCADTTRPSAGRSTRCHGPAGPGA